MVALTGDLMERKSSGQTFPPKDLGSFGDRIRETLEREWPQLSLSLPSKSQILQAEVESNCLSYLSPPSTIKFTLKCRYRG